MNKWLRSIVDFVRNPWPRQGLIIHDLSELPSGTNYEYLSDVDGCEIVGLHQIYVGLKSYIYIDDDYYTASPALYLQIKLDNFLLGHTHEWITTIDCKQYWRCKPVLGDYVLAGPIVIKYPHSHSDTCLVDTKVAIIDQEQKIRKWIEASALFDDD